MEPATDIFMGLAFDGDTTWVLAVLKESHNYFDASNEILAVTVPFCRNQSKGFAYYRCAVWYWACYPPVSFGRKCIFLIPAMLCFLSFLRFV